MYAYLSSVVFECSNLTRQASDLATAGGVEKTIATILGVADASQLDTNTSLANLGLDSLMGSEIKQALERDYDIVVSMKDIRTVGVRPVSTSTHPAPHS
jgi:acyl carrier protein